MTRKDVEAIADAIKAQANPAFDRRRFLVACGVVDTSSATRVGE